MMWLGLNTLCIAVTYLLHTSYIHTHIQLSLSHTRTEVDGVRQVSPDSPSKPLVPETPVTKIIIEEKQAADDMSVRLNVPNMRTRKNSDVTRPNPR